MGRYATDVDVAYFDDIDTSVKADRDFQQFDGTRGGFHSFLTTSLIPHLQGRGEAAADLFALAIFGEVQILVVSPRDQAKLAVLGKAGRWSACSLDAEDIARFKSEIPDESELEEAPIDIPRGDLRHLFSPPSHHGHPSSFPSTSSPSFKFLFPDLLADKRHIQQLVRDRLPSMQPLVEAIAVEDRQCSVQQYTSFTAMLRRLLTTKATPSVILLAQENPSFDGIDLFLSLLERYGTRSHDSASTSLEVLTMPYNKALESGIISGPLDMLTKLLGARNSLGENDMNLPSELMMEYILRAFEESPLSSYVADVRMRNDKTLTTIVQDIQEIGGKKEFDMQLTKAKVNAAGASVAPKQDEKVVPPGEISCPIGCARGYHLKHEPCPGLVELLKQWGREPDTRFCTHCNKPGHTTDRCFKLHPEQMPANWFCEICKKPGHFSSACPQKTNLNSTVKLTDADLKAIGNAIAVQAMGQAPAQPTVAAPPRIQVHGRG